MKWTGLAATMLVAAAAPASPQTETGPLTWATYKHLTGVFDVGGPLADGRLVVAGSELVFLLDPASG